MICLRAACGKPIPPESPSEYFCSEQCQILWNTYDSPYGSEVPPAKTPRMTSDGDVVEPAQPRAPWFMRWAC